MILVTTNPKIYLHLNNMLALGVITRCPEPPIYLSMRTPLSRNLPISLRTTSRVLEQRSGCSNAIEATLRAVFELKTKIGYRLITKLQQNAPFQSWRLGLLTNFPVKIHFSENKSNLWSHWLEAQALANPMPFYKPFQVGDSQIFQHWFYLVT